MRTTLILPDPIVLRAKRKALEEKTTLTALIIRGLEEVSIPSKTRGSLPESVAEGGIMPGIAWETLDSPGDESYR